MVKKAKQTKRDKVLDVEVLGEMSPMRNADLENLPVLNAASPKNARALASLSAILDDCDRFLNKVELQKTQKPVLPILHHFACTGGTLISKCLSVMSNVYMLSEVHPYPEDVIERKSTKYSPMDISTLAGYAGIPNHFEFSCDNFKSSIIQLYEHTSKFGGNLVLRDHSHADFCEGERKSQGLAVSILSNHFQIKSLLSVRNPVNSYYSLKKNGWIHFKNKTFEEYCARYLDFISSYEGSPVFKYENFVLNPDKELKDICAFLGLNYSDFYKFYLDLARLTGDSGRSGTSIKPRAQHEFSDVYKQEILKSKSYRKLCRILDYDLTY